MEVTGVRPAQLAKYRALEAARTGALLGLTELELFSGKVLLLDKQLVEPGALTLNSRPDSLLGLDTTEIFERLSRVVAVKHKGSALDKVVTTFLEVAVLTGPRDGKRLADAQVGHVRNVVHRVLALGNPNDRGLDEHVVVFGVLRLTCFLVVTSRM